MNPSSLLEPWPAVSPRSALPLFAPCACTPPRPRACPCPGPAPSPSQYPFSHQSCVCGLSPLVPLPSVGPWFSNVQSPYSLPSAAMSIASHCPCPGLAVPWPSRALPWFSRALVRPVCSHPALPLYHILTIDMVRTRGGSRLRPRVMFSTPEQAEQAPTSAAFPEPVPEEPQGFRRYQTRIGPRAPSLVPQRLSRRARPSKQARTSGPGESSSFRPEPSPSAIAEESSSPHLSPASRIKRPLFTGTPIPRNIDLRTRDFHGESYYDVPALAADPRFRDSMRLITQYSLLPLMTPRQFYYPRVVLQFYHSMTSRGAPSPLELRFTIDDRPRVLRAADISAALGLPAEQANSRGYRDWPQPTQRKMVRCLLRDPTAGPVLFRRQLPPQMLLVDHLLRTSLFPLQHYVQRKGAILEALYRISEGFWFSPFELVMTSLLQLEDKVHRKGLARAESLPLLMSRLLSQVLEHLGFQEEPRIERRIRFPQVLSMERAMVMPISFLLQQQDQEEVPDEEAEDSQMRDDPAPEIEVERSPVPDLSPPSPPPPHSTPVSAGTPGPSYTAQHSPEHVHVSSRELAVIMDAVCSLATTQAS